MIVVGCASQKGGVAKSSLARLLAREFAARGRRVLNAFAYTCGFSVAAALGAAAETVSVDISKRYLEWGKRNFDANDLRRSFIVRPSVDFGTLLEVVLSVPQ